MISKKIYNFYVLFIMFVLTLKNVRFKHFEINVIQKHTTLAATKS